MEINNQNNYNENMARQPSVFNKNRISIIYFGVIALILLIVFGVWAIWFRDDSAIRKNNKTPGIVNLQNSSDSNIQREEFLKIEKEIKDSWKKMGDTDGDGLSDEQEKKLGTDFEKSDTDGDFLSDGEEINMTKTDPLKKDTDNDGISDWNDNND